MDGWMVVLAKSPRITIVKHSKVTNYTVERNPFMSKIKRDGDSFYTLPRSLRFPSSSASALHRRAFLQPFVFLIFIFVRLPAGPGDLYKMVSDYFLFIPLLSFFAFECLTLVLYCRLVPLNSPRRLPILRFPHFELFG